MRQIFVKGVDCKIWVPSGYEISASKRAALQGAIVPEGVPLDATRVKFGVAEGTCVVMKGVSEGITGWVWNIRGVIVDEGEGVGSIVEVEVWV